MEKVNDDDIGHLIKILLEKKNARGGTDWGPLLIMMADYLSTINERLVGVEQLVEKLDSARENAARDPAGLTIG